MTARRYLLFVARDAAACHRRQTEWRDAAALAGFTMAVRCDRLIVMGKGETLPLKRDGREAGLVVGEIFARGGGRVLTGVPIGDAHAIAASRGQHLIEHYWGAYIAILPHRSGGVDVVRAPFGDLACYYTVCADGVMIASDTDLLIRAGGVAPRFDWAAIAQFLAAPDIRRRATCIHGISELAGGDRLAIHGGLSLETLWSPWAFVARDRQDTDLATASARLRDAVCDAVAARTKDLGATILLLSGGLDSSIVAAAMARAGRHCSGLTMVTRDPGGDERGHARATAAALDMPLRAIRRDPSAVDVGQSAASGLPYPSARSFSQATTRAAEGVAIEIGAQAIIHGGGGDNIFCSLQSAAPVADRLLTGRWGAGLTRLTRDIGALAQVTSLAVLRQAFARIALRGPAYRWPVNHSLLSAAGIDQAGDAARHPWLDPPDHALPGSAAQIGLALGAVHIVQSPHAAPPLPSIAVLLAQPVVEACLQVPSWLWFDRGRNRAVARHAFSELLPPEVAWRRSKGTMDSFIIEIFEANRTRLATMLLHGQLAASGLIDCAAVARVLADVGPTRGLAYGRIMQFADVEAWLSSWS